MDINKLAFKALSVIQRDRSVTQEKAIKKWAEDLVDSMESLPKEYSKMSNDHYWDLI